MRRSEQPRLRLRAGVDWLEVGTPLIIAEGTARRSRVAGALSHVPIVADLKTMDGGWLEAEADGQGRARTWWSSWDRLTRKQWSWWSRPDAISASRSWATTWPCPIPSTARKRLEELGCDYIVHHIGYDMRTVRKAAAGETLQRPLDRLREIVRAVSVPVQAVGGLTVEQAIETPPYGAPLVVIGAPLAIDAHAFRAAGGDLEGTLRPICERVHAYGDVEIGQGR